MTEALKLLLLSAVISLMAFNWVGEIVK